MIRKVNNYAFIDSQNLNLGIQKLGWKLDYRKFRVYLAEKFGHKLDDINVVPVDDSQEAQAEATAVALQRMDEYKKAIGDYNVTIFHLFSHPTIRTMFSGKRWNMTDEYVYRVVAGIEAYREEKGKLGLG